MSNDNETVEQVCSELRSYEGEYRLKAFGVINPQDKFLTDKILATHKREIAVKDAEIDKIKKVLIEMIELADDLKCVDIANFFDSTEVEKLIKKARKVVTHKESKVK